MTESTTFYWYDFETFGLDCRRDRPAQFAGIRTDMDLNPQGDGDVFYSGLRETICPAQRAVF